MKIKIITVGEPKLSFAKIGFAEYVKRLNTFAKIDIIHLKDNSTDEKIIESVGGDYYVVLDEKGKEFTSIELAQFIEKKSTQGIGKICFVIGGPDGHSDFIKNSADFLWSFGKMTFPHDLAMVILTEALYRAHTINIGHPYHRE